MTLVRAPSPPSNQRGSPSLPVSLDPDSVRFPNDRDFYGQSETIPAAYDSNPPILQSPLDLSKLYPTLKKIEQIFKRQDGWSDDDAPSPSFDTFRNALGWICQMYIYTSDEALRPWLTPYVGASADNEVVFEWWNGQRKLTVYVSSNSAEYVRVWGLNIHDQMADGDISSPEECINGWKWLTAEK